MFALVVDESLLLSCLWTNLTMLAMMVLKLSLFSPQDLPFNP